MFISMHSILGWVSFCMNYCINAACHEAISLWHCSGVIEAQVAFIEAFRSSALLGLAYRIFLFTIPHRFSVGFRSGKFAGQSSTVTPWSLNQRFFSIAQVRFFWRCFCFRSGLVALFLKMSERGDSWCTDSSFSSLLVKLSQVFELALLDLFSSLRSSLLLVHIFLPNFFLPVNFAFNMLWYSTPWTATSFSNDPLWFTLFVEGVFWTIAKSAVFPIIVVLKNKRYPIFILYWW